MKNKYKKLDELYKKVPEIACKGLCYQGCTIIPAALIEIKRAKDRLHTNPFHYNKEKIEEKIKMGNIPICKALKNKRCSIYTIRPLICRLYGVAENFDCPFGCKPKTILTTKEAKKIMQEIETLK